MSSLYVSVVFSNRWSFASVCVTQLSQSEVWELPLWLRDPPEVRQGAHKWGLFCCVETVTGFRGSSFPVSLGVLKTTMASNVAKGGNITQPVGTGAKAGKIKKNPLCIWGVKNSFKARVSLTSPKDV